VKTIIVDGNSLSLEDVLLVARGRATVRAADGAKERAQRGREYVERLIAEDSVVYGVTTGFGKFSEVRIEGSEILTLQRNLILSHCCGVGEPLSVEETRAVMLLRANVLAKGCSGTRLVVLETLIHMINRGVHPVIPSKGSVGASGDLAPLAHLTRAMIGEGEAFYRGQRVPARVAMQAARIKPLVLEAKEGLALINGTQVMTALGTLALFEAETVAKAADVACAMTLEALRGTNAPYLPLTHAVRPHAGQRVTARNLMRLLEHSEILPSHHEVSLDHRVQDAYSLRCAPQVHGAVKDALAFVRAVLETEVNSATDNPLVFPEQEMVISGGNFHGQPISQAMDFMSIALAETAGISERRVEYMMDPSTSEHLPAFLTRHGGLNSGLMMAQVTAAALTSENKTLAHPACVDSIPTSANKEDFVSMGAFASRKARDVAKNALYVVSVELLCAAQGLEFAAPGLRPGRGVEAAWQVIREKVAPLEGDRAQTPDIEAIAALVESGKLLSRVEDAVGPLDLAVFGPEAPRPSTAAE
jgi:histidine ammonia-lyase